jgi:lysozyme
MTNLRSSPRAKAAIAGIASLSVAGLVTLFHGQPPVHDDVALAVKTLVQPWEGRSLKAYPDPVTHGKPWTICDGDTLDVKPGMVETPAGCDKRTVNRMEREFRPQLVKCVNGWEGRPLSWRAMMLSLAWNIGWSPACTSTAARLGRSGQYPASCTAATAFNKAGGHVIIGIVHRREMGDSSRIGEGELCVSGLAK